MSCLFFIAGGLYAVSGRAIVHGRLLAEVNDWSSDLPFCAPARKEAVREHGANAGGGLFPLRLRHVLGGGACSVACSWPQRVVAQVRWR